MYKAFFKLARNPFDLTPDPTYFVSTRRHNEALAALHYGIRRHKGFVVVTGEVGTGKTLLLRCLLRLLKESKDIAYAYLFNSRLSPTEFLQYILSDFGLPASGKNKSELLLDLGQFLVARIEGPYHRSYRGRGASLVRGVSKRYASSLTSRRLTINCCRSCWSGNPNWIRSWIPLGSVNSNRESLFARSWDPSMPQRPGNISSSPSRCRSRGRPQRSVRSRSHSGCLSSLQRLSPADQHCLRKRADHCLCATNTQSECRYRRRCRKRVAASI